MAQVGTKLAALGTSCPKLAFQMQALMYKTTRYGFHIPLDRNLAQHGDNMAPKTSRDGAPRGRTQVRVFTLGALLALRWPKEAPRANFDICLSVFRIFWLDIAPILGGGWKAGRPILASIYFRCMPKMLCFGDCNGLLPNDPSAVEAFSRGTP